MPNRLKEYHYTECGLDNVIIVIEDIGVDDSGEKVVIIPAVKLLHKCIAESVISEQGILSGKEIRFLRTEIGLTQAEIADIMHRDSQSIARWEKGETAIDPAHDLLLRQLVAERLDISLGEDDSIETLSRQRIATSKSRQIKMKLDQGDRGAIYTLVA